MTLPTQYSDINLAESLRDIILSCGIVPETTLTAQANPGDTVLQVADNSRFLPGGVFDFGDLVGEELCTIGDKSANGVTPQTITLDFTGTGNSGLTETHTLGTTVFTNLMTDAPADLTPGMSLGDPFIWVMTKTDQDFTFGMHKTRGPMQLHVSYFRQLARPNDGPGTRMALNVWAKRQQKAARTDLDVIARAVKSNRSLAVEGRPEQAVDLGDLRQDGAQIMQRTWAKMTVVTDTEMFIAELDIVVTKAFDTY